MQPTCGSLFGVESPGNSSSLTLMKPLFPPGSAADALGAPMTMKPPRTRARAPVPARPAATRERTVFGKNFCTDFGNGFNANPQVVDVMAEPPGRIMSGPGQVSTGHGI